MCINRCTKCKLFHRVFFSYFQWKYKMLSTFSSVQRTSVPLYNLCKNQVLHTTHCDTISLQKSWMNSSPSKPETTRAYNSLSNELICSSATWNTAYTDKYFLDGRESSDNHDLKRNLSHCSNMKEGNILSKVKFANHNTQKYCKEKTKLPGKIYSRLKKLPSDASYLTSAGETNTLMTKSKSWTTFQRRKRLCSSWTKQNNERRSNSAGYLFTNGMLLNRKSTHRLKLHSLFHTTTRSCDQQSTGAYIREQPPWRVMFFGTDDISLYTIKELYNNM